MTDATLLARLQGAYADFEARRFGSVVESLEALPGNGGPLGRGLLLVARGLTLEQDGRHAEAARLLEQASALDVALPAVLHELAGFFQRTGRSSLAHHAFLAHELMAPGGLEAFLSDMPAHERARYAPWALRSSSWAGKGDLYGLAVYKSALRESLGPEAAATVLAGMREPQGPRLAARRPLVRLIDHAREHGVGYAERIPAAASLSTPIPVHGRPEGEREERRSRALFTCILEDTVVTARSNVLLAGDRALLDVQDDELLRRPHDLAVDPIVAWGGPEEVITVEPADRGSLRSIPEAVWLSGVHSPAFGHWIMEFLPRVWALMARPGFGDLPIIIDERMPSQHVEALRVFAGETNPLIVLKDHESVRVSRLWVSSNLVYLPVGPLPAATGARRTRNGLDDAGFLRLLEPVRPVLEAIGTEGTPKRIYLTRKPWQHRRLVNGPVVEELLAGHGFVTYDFADLGFREQVRLVRGADHVVAAGGSSSLTTIFGRPGLRVAVLAPPHYSDTGWLTQACRALGHELTVLVGSLANEHPSYRWMSDYEIDPAELAAYLAGTRPQPTSPDAVR